MKRTTITVDLEGGPKQIEAAVDRSGIFAVHPTGEMYRIRGSDQWRLTHVPSGRLLGWFSTRKAAVACIPRLAELPADWRSPKPFNTVSREVRDMCLAVTQQ